MNDFGTVYLLHEFGSSPEKYKIGISKGPVEKRIKNIQTGNSYEIILINQFQTKYFRKIETHLHKLYSKYSTDGGKEWFTLPSSEVFNFKSICQKLNDNFKFLEENNDFFS